MAKDDWAVVVGIKTYFDPALAGLQGPENDASDFYEWLISSKGGDVPKGQARLILSSSFPPFASAAAAKPSAESIKDALDHFLTIAAANQARGLTPAVGRRLNLFFSGHGFAPSQHDDLTALLTADASVASGQ